MVDLLRLSQPIGNFPVQSYGRTVDGRAVYVRYRSGILTVQVARDTHEHGAYAPVVYEHHDGTGNGCVDDEAEWRTMLAPACRLPDTLGAVVPEDDPAPTTTE